MIKRKWFNGNYNKQHQNLPIKQIYARIYIKVKNQIIIVSKDGLKWQMPGGKPEIGESSFQTLQREIYEETSIKIDENQKSISYPSLFGYYYIEEKGEEYLQVRYFIEIEDVDEKMLKPNEKISIDAINYIKLIKIDEIDKIIPRLYKSGELKGFIKKLNQTKKLKNELSLKNGFSDDIFLRPNSKNKRYIDTQQIKNKLKTFLSLNKGIYKKLVWQLYSDTISGNNDYVIDGILKDILGISFFEFNNNEKYQKYIRTVFGYRIIESHTQSINEYSDYVSQNTTEKSILIGYISPSTSYFFRDDIFSEIRGISKFLNKKNNNILILGCSTGAEAYSLAYSLKELNIKYNIIATDINQYTLKYAKEGKYPESIINTIDKNISNKLFLKNSIRNKYRLNLEFKQLNILCKHEYPDKYFDLIIVRNTIKYFDNGNKKIAFANITSKISSGGLLMFGLQYGSNRDVNPKKYISCDLVGNYTYKITNK